MATVVGVRDLRNRLSHCLARVKGGETITIRDRGREIATISRSAARETPRDRISTARRDGAPWSNEWLHRLPPPVRMEGGRSFSHIVIEEREQSPCSPEAATCAVVTRRYGTRLWRLL